jgi:tRNA threonylcarbamoyladenosine biosynthesis protein TsaB
MGWILCLETATQICSVALCREGRVAYLKETDEPNAHSRVLAILIRDILEEAGIRAEELDAVAVSKGPGSYTGLRIGVSAAKGLSYGRDLPLISVPSLASLAAGAMALEPGADLYGPMIDAKRMEVYSALFDKDGKEVLKTDARIVDERSFSDFLPNHRILFFGDGADKCRSVLTHPNALFHKTIRASASYMARLVQEKFNAADFEDNAYFEPFYLKDFVAAKPKIKGLFE